MEVGRDSHGVWDGHAHTAISKMGHQLGPATQQRALCSMLCGGLDGGGVWGERVHVYVWLSPYAAHLKLSQHG